MRFFPHALCWTSDYCLIAWVCPYYLWCCLRVGHQGGVWESDMISGMRAWAWRRA